jgi:hypothetical protein
LSTKALRQRVELLRQVDAFGSDYMGQTNEKLKERIDLIETVKQLEPNGQTSLRSLRERVRLLREVGSRVDPQDEAIEGLQDEAAEETWPKLVPTLSNKPAGEGPAD